MASQTLILIADDFPDAGDMYAEYLGLMGYQCIVARGGQEAIDLALSRRPALILMDISMPVVSGVDAMRLIRADERMVSTPIVALTSHAFEHERSDALQAGFDEVICKPLLPEDLVKAVKRLLSTARQARKSLA